MREHRSVPTQPATLLLLAALMIGFTACGPREATPPPVAEAPAAPDAKPDPAPPPASAASAPVATAKVPPPAAAAAKAASPEPATMTAPPSAPTSTPAPAQAPSPEAKPPVPTPKPSAPAQAISAIPDPGGEVSVKPTKAGLTRVGSAACKMCHKIQFGSWSGTAHAKRAPTLDCESCHGAGSDYKAMSIMKDPAKAKAAGLVQPGAPFCATCHKRNWNDGMLKKAHAHKA